MKYLVMETHPAYAVVLDEDGRFLKAANLRYQVGDTVQDIVELRTPQKKVVPAWKPLSGLAAAAACLCLVFFGWYQPNYTAYGTLRIQINPDVEMTVSRTDRVLDLEGLNADGETVSITVSSTDADWQAREETQVRAQLEARYGETIVIRLGSDPAPEVTPPQADPPEIVIPVTPPAAAEDATDYGDTDYGPNADGATDYADTDHGPYTDGGTDYEGRDDGSDDGDDDDD